MVEVKRSKNSKEINASVNFYFSLSVQRSASWFIPLHMCPRSIENLAFMLFTFPSESSLEGLLTLSGHQTSFNYLNVQQSFSEAYISSCGCPPSLCTLILWCWIRNVTDEALPLESEDLKFRSDCTIYYLCDPQEISSIL